MRGATPAAAETLLAELRQDPAGFDASGRAYDLLRCYFKGYPVSTLRPLLSSDNVYIQKCATFVASELGAGSSELVDEVVPLVEAKNLHTQWYAMEVLAVCAVGESARKLLPVVRMLDSPEPALRRLAGRLIARADDSQLLVARRYFEESGRTDRLQLLLEGRLAEDSK